MIKFLPSALCAPLLVVGLLTLPAHATTLHNATGLSGVFNTENFDSNAGPGTAAANQFSGLTFGAGNYVNNNYNGTFPNIVNSAIDNYSNGRTTPTTVSFSQAMSDVAFAFVTNPGTTIFSAYLGATLVESLTDSTSFLGDFYGFTNIRFDSIVIDTSAIKNPSYFIDSLQSRAAQIEVPEPSSIALLGLALLGLGVARRRQ